MNTAKTLTAFLVASASLWAAGCESAPMNADPDCETCDIDPGALEVREVAGMLCAQAAGARTIDCFGLPTDTGSIAGAVFFEGRVSAHPAPVIESDSIDVHQGVLEDGFELDLGSGYVPGSQFSLRITDGSYYDAMHDDWFPFASDELVAPAAGLPASEVLDASVIAQIGLNPDSKVSAIGLPFVYWDVVVIDNIRDGERVALSYSIPGDESVRVPTFVADVPTSASIVVGASQQDITLRLDSAALTISGPTVIIAELGDSGEPVLREATDADLRY